MQQSRASQQTTGYSWEARFLVDRHASLAPSTRATYLRCVLWPLWIEPRVFACGFVCLCFSLDTSTLPYSIFSHLAMPRPTLAEIDLDALEQNWHHLRGVHAKGQLMTVLKANAYGHGITHTALFLQSLGQGHFGVALLDEALCLRQAGILGRITVLGAPEPERWQDYLTHTIEATIPSLAHLKLAVDFLTQRLIPPKISPSNTSALETTAASAVGPAGAPHHTAAGTTLRIHLKVDTGMHRIGWIAPPDQALLTLLNTSPHLVLQGIYSHLASASQVRASQNQAQHSAFLAWIERFSRLSQGAFSPELHLANSAGLLQNPAFHFDYARVGYGLWGPVAFTPPQAAPDINTALRPVLKWHTRIAQLKCMPAAGKIGYGALTNVPAATWVATLPVGYADGYGRGMFPNAKVLIGGQRWPLAGMVSMDQTGVSLGKNPPKQIGLHDEVVLLGTQGEESISVHESAGWADEIEHAWLCGIRSRVPRRYLYKGQPWTPPSFTLAATTPTPPPKL